MPPQADVRFHLCIAAHCFSCAAFSMLQALAAKNIKFTDWAHTCCQLRLPARAALSWSCNFANSALCAEPPRDPPGGRRSADIDGQMTAVSPKRIRSTLPFRPHCSNRSGGKRHLLASATHCYRDVGSRHRGNLKTEFIFARAQVGGEPNLPFGQAAASVWSCGILRLIIAIKFSEPIRDSCAFLVKIHKSFPEKSRLCDIEKAGICDWSLKTDCGQKKR